MNKDLQNHQPSRGVSVRATEFFSGPLPPPEVLEKFESIVPGAAERIIKMAEDQSTHRKDLEKKVIESDIARSKWGQILGFMIAIGGLIASIIVAVYGSAIAGSIIGVGTLASLVSVFMYGSKTQNESKEE